MMKPFLFACYLFPLLLWGQVDSFKNTIYFITNGADISFEMEKPLAALFDSVESYQSYQVILNGYTDNQGNPPSNLLLSQQRCLAVKAFCVQKKKMPDSVFVLKFWGEQKPIGDNNTVIGRQFNRRVEIVVKYTRKQLVLPAPVVVANQPPPLPVSPKVEIPKESIFSLYKKTNRKLQKFIINTEKDTAIRCEQGTVIYLKAFSFSLSQDCRNEKITFYVKEDYLLSDMILDNLSTTSFGKPIETKGMVYTEARDCKGQKIDLRPSRDMVVMMPTDSPVAQAKIFEGQRNPHDSVMNWVVSNSSVLSNFGLQDLIECNRWLNCMGPGFNCEDCPFFFCRIKRFPLAIRGIFNQTIRTQNKEFRICLKEKKKYEHEVLVLNAYNKTRAEENLPEIPLISLSRPTLDVDLLPTCEELEILFYQYKVKDLDALMLAINRPLMDSLGVKNLADLRGKINSMQLENLALAYKNKQISFKNFQYYVFNQSRLGWANCDVFTEIPPENLITMNINLKPDSNIDCKLVFINRSFVLPPASRGFLYKFEEVPKNEAVWVVALKYENGKPYLSMKKTEISSTLQEVDFKVYTYEDLMKQLKELDR